MIKLSFLTKRQSFRLVQIVSICRRQNKCDLKTEICFGRITNIVGQGENAGYQHFSPFPTMFSKSFFFRRREKSGLCCIELIFSTCNGNIQPSSHLVPRNSEVKMPDLRQKIASHKLQNSHKVQNNIRKTSKDHNEWRRKKISCLF